jgi:hypothetical protein
LHDVLEIRSPTQHALSQARNILAMRVKQLLERLGIAVLAALHEARGFHEFEFNSGWRRGLALGDISPRGDADKTLRRGRKH